MNGNRMTNEEAAAILENEAEYLYSQDEPYNRQAFKLAIDALQEHKTGKWHYNRCSECKCLCTYFLKGSYMIDIEKRPNYCPNCGAKMEIGE